jgi:transposase
MRLGRRQKEGQLSAGLFYRIRARRGNKKAILAEAASMLTAIYHMLKDGTMYQDLGHNYFDQRSKETQTQRLIMRLAELGYAAELTPITA